MQVHEAISKRNLDNVDMYAALTLQTDRLFPIFEHKATTLQLRQGSYLSTMWRNDKAEIKITYLVFQDIVPCLSTKNIADCDFQ